MPSLALSLVFLLLNSCISVWSLGKSATPSRQASATIKVINTCMDCDGKFSVSGGSGTSLSSSFALTAQHVIDCPSGVQAVVIERADGQQLLAEVDVEAVKSDIARIRLVEGEFKTWIKRIADVPSVDDKICFESALPGRNRRCGWVQAVTNRRNGDIRHSAVTEPGNSGGGAYNEDGELIGVVTRAYACNDIFNLYTERVCGGLVSSIWKHRHFLEVQ